ncbi:hypothetical protein [Nocardia colli]|nr:hypothetical protein [Nocardia colli]
MIGACALIAVIVVVVMVTRSRDSDPVPGTPEPTLWIESEFG